MSKITVVGNMVDDPELRFTPSGAAVSTFRMAENRRKFNKATNEYEDAGTTFYRVTAWRGLAENVAESLSKGQRVIVAGEFHSEEFDRRDGSKGLGLEINADSVGPDLSYATASVTKVARGNPSSGQGGGGRTPVAAGAPASATGDDPWTSNEPPF
jgi:single-strand DNA-binding protein